MDRYVVGFAKTHENGKTQVTFHFFSLTFDPRIDQGSFSSYKSGIVHCKSENGFVSLSIRNYSSQSMSVTIGKDNYMVERKNVGIFFVPKGDDQSIIVSGIKVPFCVE